MDYPGPVGLRSASGELRMPFPEPVKYLILGVSVTLLLVALGILAWQMFRCWTQTYTTPTRPDPVCADLLRSGHLSAAYSGAPGTQVQDVSAQVHRWSRCLLEAPFPPSAPEEHTRKLLSTNRVDGSLRFSVFYDRLQSRLVVTILQVEGLQEHNPTRTLQPFVRLRLMWAGAEAVETEGCTDEQVRDFDTFSRHAVLGEVRRALDPMHTSCPLELHQELQAPHKDLVGEVLLSLKFLPTSQRLEVGLLKVRLVLADISSEAALCARISVQCNQCKLRHQRTSALSYCPVTVFNQVFLFSLPELRLEQCKILVSVYAKATARKSAKHLIGQLTVGKQMHSEDKHWSLMMTSVRQPTAMWHGLLL